MTGILGIIHRQNFIKTDVLETELCLRSQVNILLSEDQSIELVHISVSTWPSFYLRTETESSFRNVVFNKTTTVHNVRKV
jgi:hypothetical protein